MGYHFREQSDYVRLIEMSPALRRRIEKTIEGLVALLDAVDGDWDLEPCAGDEPEFDQAESGIADEDALHEFMQEWGLYEGYDGSGARWAKSALKSMSHQRREIVR